MDPVERFYKIKSTYDKKFIKYKNTVINSDLSKIKKKVKIASYKPQCINCKRKVGTFFSIKNKQLSIRCGDAVNPCGLEYIVNLGTYGYIPDLIQYFYKNLERIKKNIIQIKLSLLFGLDSEENISETFSKLRDEYKQALLILDNLESSIFNDEKIEYQHLGEDVTKHRTIAKKHYKQLLGNMINEYKSIIHSLSDIDSSSDHILNDAIDKYKTTIIPLNNQIREKFFDIVSVIDDDIEEDKKRLVKLVLTPNKYEVEYTSSEILSDKK